MMENESRNMAHDATEEPVFHAVITPHRSLDRNGFTVLMLIVVVLIVTTGIMFLAVGAWPVVGFLGLDILIVWLAFRANYRAARAREIIILDQNRLLVRRVAADGHSTEWAFNPYWARLVVRRDEDGDVTSIVIRSHGRDLAIAGQLAPVERDEFATAFGAALSGVRENPAPG